MRDARSFRYAYLHGFASGPRSYKGGRFAEALAARDVRLERLDLNRPSFEELTFTAALAAIDEADRLGADPARRWRLIGSSMGGYLAALWAARRPERVESLVLLCPGFGLTERWPSILGAKAMDAWRREGRIDWPDGDGRLRSLHWRFVEDARGYPPEPAVPCRTLILHGRRDDVVPIAASRGYAARHPQVTLVELDDGHALVETCDRVVEHVLRFFGFEDAAAPGLM